MRFNVYVSQCVCTWRDMSEHWTAHWLLLSLQGLTFCCGVGAALCWRPPISWWRGTRASAWLTGTTWRSTTWCRRTRVTTCARSVTVTIAIRSTLSRYWVSDGILISVWNRSSRLNTYPSACYLAWEFSLYAGTCVLRYDNIYRKLHSFLCDVQLFQKSLYTRCCCRDNQVVFALYYYYYYSLSLYAGY